MPLLSPELFAGRPTLFYGYQPGCPGCLLTGPVVDQVADEFKKQGVQLVRVDVTGQGTNGARFPVPIEYTPALALVAPATSRKVWTFDFSALEAPLDAVALREWVDEGLSALRAR